MAQKMGKKEEDKKKKSEKHSHHDKPSVPGYNARLNPISPSQQPDMQKYTRRYGENIL